MKKGFIMKKIIYLTFMSLGLLASTAYADYVGKITLINQSNDSTEFIVSAGTNLASSVPLGSQTVAPGQSYNLDIEAVTNKILFIRTMTEKPNTYKPQCIDISSKNAPIITLTTQGLQISNGQLVACGNPNS